MPNPNSTDTLESLATKLESTHKKLFLMKKRLDRWGLNDEEKIKLEKLSTEYLETHYKLVDLTFTDHIEPFLYTDKIIDLKTKMEEKYNWSGEIMFDDDYMESVMKSIEDVDDFLDDIDELEKLELSQVGDFIDTPSGEEIEDAFKNLMVFENESEDKLDSISRYIISRSDITKKLVNIYFNFEEFEYLFKLVEDCINDECTLDNEDGDDIDEY